MQYKKRCFAQLCGKSGILNFIELSCSLTQFTDILREHHISYLVSFKVPSVTLICICVYRVAGHKGLV